MKATYLIHKQINGVQQLAVATQEEWDAILKKNRKLPLEHRRRFINDCIKDGKELDCIFTEVSTEEHRMILLSSHFHGGSSERSSEG